MIMNFQPLNPQMKKIQHMGLYSNGVLDNVVKTK
jgi:hypothetical protein